MTKCEVKKCEEEAIAIIRTKDVCKKHFRAFKSDNKERMDKGENIPNKLNYRGG